jgi:hypothetical protein
MLLQLVFFTQVVGAWRICMLGFDLELICSMCLLNFDLQPPASSIFLSEQTSHQQPASSTFLSEQISTSHQPNEQAELVY